jgi:hypothetical protein
MLCPEPFFKTLLGLGLIVEFIIKAVFEAVNLNALRVHLNFSHLASNLREKGYCPENISVSETDSKLNVV